jgi:arsenate reductase (thioredoxin)
MARVLFVCLHNAGRSQMSEALFERAAGGRHEARSAGTTPGERVHPEVVEVMGELGVDLTTRTPRKLSAADTEWADVVVTMGCGDECPYIPGKRYLDWDLEDPKGRPIDEVRLTRDEIERRVDELRTELTLRGTTVTSAWRSRAVVKYLGAGAVVLVDYLRALGGVQGHVVDNSLQPVDSNVRP